MCNARLFALAAAAASICIIAGGTPQEAHAAMSEQEARASVEREFGVKVLKIGKVELGGKPVYLLTVMSPGGNANAAFQVNRLALDPETGRLVSGFRHLSSGYDNAEGARANEADRQPAEALRQRWNWR